ncbi:MAG: CotH kinase family protein [Bacteroidota bacterium]
MMHTFRILSILCCFLVHTTANAQFTSQHPLVFIETNGQEIVDEPDILAQIRVIDNGDGMPHSIDDPATYEGYVTIELRGNSSLDFPKKSYGFETADANGEDMDVALLGFPIEEDWILYSGWADKTFLRNVLAMHLSREMGYYASQTRFCEVFLNDEYQGLYVLMEKIKRDNNRVDIAKLSEDDTTGEPRTGGYILKFDWNEEEGWATNSTTITGQPLFLQYVYPKPEDLQYEQQTYIQSFIDSFELALFAPNYTNSFGKHYSDYADINSFVDLFIVNELSKNVDAYKLSTFIHKDRDKNGGKLKAGPIWDYDIAWYNSDYCAGGEFEGWIYNEENCEDLEIMPRWWARFLADPMFQERLCERWSTFRQDLLSESNLLNWIDAQAAFIDAAQERNYALWESLNEPTWAHPEIAGTYQGEVDLLKNFIQQRLVWMDEELNCITSTASPASDDELILNIHPNPTNDGSFQLDVQFPTQPKRVDLSIYSAEGRLMHERTFSAPLSIFSERVSTVGWVPGTYFVSLNTDAFQLNRSIIIAE